MAEEPRLERQPMRHRLTMEFQDETRLRWTPEEIQACTEVRPIIADDLREFRFRAQA
jgi:hypothetical protein